MSNVSLVAETTDGWEARVEYARDLRGWYRHQAAASSSVQAAVHDKVYVSKSVSESKAPPSSLRAVMRTPTVWVDRQKVRLAFLLTDSDGTPLIDKSGASVSCTLSLGTLTKTFGCSIQTSSSKKYISHCSTDSLGSSWFAATGAASATLSLKFGSTVAATASLPASLSITPQPAWWDSSLRSSTTGSGLSIPTGTSGLESGGIFMTLPASSVYASEAFDVYIYASTGGYSLAALGIQVSYSDSLLECAGSCSSSFTQSSDFNAATMTSTAGRLVFSITGVASSTEAADTTGTAIFLFKVRLRFKSGVGAGKYDGTTLGLYPFADALVNSGGFSFVSTDSGTQRGLVFDARDAAQSHGQMTVDAKVDRGVFGYFESPVLLNSARLGSASPSYTPTVVKVTSDSSHNDAQATAEIERPRPRPRPRSRPRPMNTWTWPWPTRHAHVTACGRGVCLRRRQ